MLLIYEIFRTGGDRKMPLSQPPHSPRQEILTADRTPMPMVYNLRVLWCQLPAWAEFSQFSNWHRRWDFPLLIGVNNQPESHEKSRFHPSLDPPRIPLKKGDFEQIPVPPLRRGTKEKIPVPPLKRE